MTLKTIPAPEEPPFVQHSRYVMFHVVWNIKIMSSSNRKSSGFDTFTNTASFKLSMGFKFWSVQLLPPLSMLGVLVATDSGTSLVFLTGLFIFPVLFSVISMIAKLFNFRQRKYYWVRPTLTIAIFVLIFFIAHWTYRLALEQAIDEAKLIHQQCKENLRCPETPKGWNDNKMKVGFWLTYRAMYYPSVDSFKIHVYQGPDLGDDITGGANSPFNVSHYVD